MSLEATNITVDEKWVENLIKKIQKYDMFKDQRQKIVECIRQAENDQKSVQKNEVTQNMVEEWCKDHKVKLVLAKDLLVELDEDGSRNDSLSKCPCVWVKPFHQYSSEYELGDDEELPGVGSCAIHEQCARCNECIDGSEGCWEGKNGKVCTRCKIEHKIKVLPSGCSSIDICLPNLVKKVVKKVPKKAVAKKEAVVKKIQKKSDTPVVKKIVEKAPVVHKKVNPLVIKLKMMKLDELKRIAAENGISSSGTQDVLLKNLEKYLELHGKFKRDLK